MIFLIFVIPFSTLIVFIFFSTIFETYDYLNGFFDGTRWWSSYAYKWQDQVYARLYYKYHTGPLYVPYLYYFIYKARYLAPIMQRRRYSLWEFPWVRRFSETNTVNFFNPPNKEGYFKEFKYGSAYKYFYWPFRPYAFVKKDIIELRIFGKNKKRHKKRRRNSRNTRIFP